MTTEQLSHDFAAVRAYFSARGLKGYTNIMQAIDPELAMHTERIRYLWNRPTLGERDADLVRRMVRVVEILKDNAGV